MAQNIATLAIKFVADTTGIKTGVAGVVNQVLTGAAAFIAFNRAIAAFTASADRIDRMSKIADRLGLSFKTIQSAKLSAGLAGLNIEQLTKAFDHMSKTIGSGGMSLDKRFLQQAKAIAAIKDPAAQASTAMKIFGKAGADLLPLLKTGGAAFEESARLIDRFDLGITELEGKNVERMNDSWTKLEAVIGGATDKVLSRMAPAMGQFLDDTIDRLEDLGSTLTEVGITWDSLGDGVTSFFAEFSNISDLAKGVGADMASVAYGVKAAWLETWDVIDNALRGVQAKADSAIRQRQIRESYQKAALSSTAASSFFDRFQNDAAGKEFRDRVEARRLSGGGEFGSSSAPGMASPFSPSAARGSIEAAKIINASVGGATASPEVKAALDAARDTAKVRQNTDTLVALFAANPPVLALGGI